MQPSTRRSPTSKGVKGESGAVFTFDLAGGAASAEGGAAAAASPQSPVLRRRRLVLSPYLGTPAATTSLARRLASLVRASPAVAAAEAEAGRVDRPNQGPKGGVAGAQGLLLPWHGTELLERLSFVPPPAPGAASPAAPRRASDYRALRGSLHATDALAAAPGLVASSAANDASASGAAAAAAAAASASLPVRVFVLGGCARKSAPVSVSAKDVSASQPTKGARKAASVRAAASAAPSPEEWFYSIRVEPTFAPADGWTVLRSLEEVGALYRALAAVNGAAELGSPFPPLSQGSWMHPLLPEPHPVPQGTAPAPAACADPLDALQAFLRRALARPAACDAEDLLLFLDAPARVLAQRVHLRRLEALEAALQAATHPAPEALSALRQRIRLMRLCVQRTDRVWRIAQPAPVGVAAAWEAGTASDGVRPDAQTAATPLRSRRRAHSAARPAARQPLARAQLPAESAVARLANAFADKAAVLASVRSSLAALSFPVAVAEALQVLVPATSHHAAAGTTSGRRVTVEGACLNALLQVPAPAPSTGGRMRSSARGCRRRALSCSNVPALAAGVARAAADLCRQPAAASPASSCILPFIAPALSTEATAKIARAIQADSAAVPSGPRRPLSEAAKYVLAHAADSIVADIAPSKLASERRREVGEFVSRLLQASCGLETRVVGASVRQTYLPDSGIDMLALLPASKRATSWTDGSLCPAAEAGPVKPKIGRDWFVRANEALTRASKVVPAGHVRRASDPKEVASKQQQQPEPPVATLDLLKAAALKAGIPASPDVVATVRDLVPIFPSALLPHANLLSAETRRAIPVLAASVIADQMRREESGSHGSMLTRESVQRLARFSLDVPRTKHYIQSLGRMGKRLQDALTSSRRRSSAPPPVVRSANGVDGLSIASDPTASRKNSNASQRTSGSDRPVPPMHSAANVGNTEADPKPTSLAAERPPSPSSNSPPSSTTVTSMASTLKERQRQLALQRKEREQKKAAAAQAAGADASTEPAVAAPEPTSPLQPPTPEVAAPQTAVAQFTTYQADDAIAMLRKLSEAKAASTSSATAPQAAASIQDAVGIDDSGRSLSSSDDSSDDTSDDTDTDKSSDDGSSSDFSDAMSDRAPASIAATNTMDGNSKSGTQQQPSKDIDASVIHEALALASVAKALQDAARRSAIMDGVKVDANSIIDIADIVATPLEVIVQDVLGTDRRGSGNMELPAPAPQNAAGEPLPSWLTASDGSYFHVRSISFHTGEPYPEFRQGAEGIYRRDIKRPFLRILVDKIWVTLRAVDEADAIEYVLRPEDSVPSDSRANDPPLDPLVFRKGPAHEAAYDAFFEDTAALCEAVATAAALENDTQGMELGSLEGAANAPVIARTLLVRLPSVDPFQLHSASTVAAVEARQTNPLLAAQSGGGEKKRSSDADKSRPVSSARRLEISTPLRPTSTDAFFTGVAAKLAGVNAAASPLPLMAQQADPSDVSIAAASKFASLISEFGPVDRTDKTAGASRPRVARVVRRTHIVKRTCSMIQAWLHYEAPVVLRSFTAKSDKALPFSGSNLASLSPQMVEIMVLALVMECLRHHDKPDAIEPSWRSLLPSLPLHPWTLFRAFFDVYSRIDFASTVITVTGILPLVDYSASLMTTGPVADAFRAANLIARQDAEANAAAAFITSWATASNPMEEPPRTGNAVRTVADSGSKKSRGVYKQKKQWKDNLAPSGGTLSSMETFGQTVMPFNIPPAILARMAAVGFIPGASPVPERLTSAETRAHKRGIPFPVIPTALPYDVLAVNVMLGTGNALQLRLGIAYILNHHAPFAMRTAGMGTPRIGPVNMPLVPHAFDCSDRIAGSITDPGSKGFWNTSAKVTIHIADPLFPWVNIASYVCLEASEDIRVAFAAGVAVVDDVEALAEKEAASWSSGEVLSLLTRSATQVRPAFMPKVTHLFGRADGYSYRPDIVKDTLLVRTPLHGPPRSKRRKLSGPPPYNFHLQHHSTSLAGHDYLPTTRRLPSLPEWHFLLHDARHQDFGYPLPGYEWIDVDPSFWSASSPIKGELHPLLVKRLSRVPVPNPHPTLTLTAHSLLSYGNGSPVGRQSVPSIFERGNEPYVTLMPACGQGCTVQNTVVPISNALLWLASAGPGAAAAAACLCGYLYRYRLPSSRKNTLRDSVAPSSVPSMPAMVVVDEGLTAQIRMPRKLSGALQNSQMALQDETLPADTSLDAGDDDLEDLVDRKQSSVSVLSSASQQRSPNPSAVEKFSSSKPLLSLPHLTMVDPHRTPFDADARSLFLTKGLVDSVCHVHYSRDALVSLLVRCIGQPGVVSLSRLREALAEVVDGTSKIQTQQTSPKHAINCVIDRAYGGLSFLLTAHPFVFHLGVDNEMDPHCTLAGHFPLYPFLNVGENVYSAVAQYLKAFAHLEEMVMKNTPVAFISNARHMLASGRIPEMDLLKLAEPLRSLDLSVPPALDLLRDNCQLLPEQVDKLTIALREAGISVPPTGILSLAAPSRPEGAVSIEIAMGLLPIQTSSLPIRRRPTAETPLRKWSSQSLLGGSFFLPRNSEFFYAPADFAEDPALWAYVCLSPPYASRLLGISASLGCSEALATAHAAATKPWQTSASSPMSLAVPMRKGSGATRDSRPQMGPGDRPNASVQSVARPEYGPQGGRAMPGAPLTSAASVRSDTRSVSGNAPGIPSPRDRDFRGSFAEHGHGLYAGGRGQRAMAGPMQQHWQQERGNSPGSYNGGHQWQGDQQSQQQGYHRQQGDHLGNRDQSGRRQYSRGSSFNYGGPGDYRQGTGSVNSQYSAQDGRRGRHSDASSSYGPSQDHYYAAQAMQYAEYAAQPQQHQQQQQQYAYAPYYQHPFMVPQQQQIYMPQSQQMPGVYPGIPLPQSQQPQMAYQYAGQDAYGRPVLQYAAMSPQQVPGYPSMPMPLSSEVTALTAPAVPSVAMASTDAPQPTSTYNAVPTTQPVASQAMIQPVHGGAQFTPAPRMTTPAGPVIVSYTQVNGRTAPVYLYPDGSMYAQMPDQAPQQAPLSAAESETSPPPAGNAGGYYISTPSGYVFMQGAQMVPPSPAAYYSASPGTHPGDYAEQQQPMPTSPSSYRNPGQ